MSNRLRTTTLLVLCLALLAASATAIAAKRQLSSNPANDPTLIRKKLDPNRYDGADGCVGREPKGMRELVRWMKRNTKRSTVYGTIRCDGGVHSTGRALDWMLDARRPRQKRLAMRVINTWLADDRRGRPNALARRMGIQLLIFNCRWWQAGDSGWSRYGACSGGKKNADPTQGHIDHIHVELTKPASALRTTYWEFTPDQKGNGGGVSPRGRSAPVVSSHPPLHPPESATIAAQMRR